MRSNRNEYVTDGWINGWMDGSMDGWMEGWMDGWMDGQTDGWTDGWTDRQVGGWLNIYIGCLLYYGCTLWTSERINKWTEVLNDTCTCTCTCISCILQNISLLIQLWNSLSHSATPYQYAVHLMKITPSQLKQGVF